ncbi:MAG TPA: isoaspartyl peptidase/L-asparaginase family protein [Phenylobacterium sp.]|nr:isoaspartyl peptidase/L-asparaginase family protein [Phenylobacterium sp.]
MSSGGWSLMVHGGAREIPPDRAQAHRAGCLAAAAQAAAILREGGPAVLAAEAAVRALEDDPVFNAGRGSVLNRAGQVECDAAIMEGRNLAFGAVGALRGFRHPVSVAAALLKQPRFLVGEGAARFARETGAETCWLEAYAPSGPEPGCDTVGCVARDRTGSLAAATSTGGLTGCEVGRVGDSPLPGSGLYADDGAGAAAFSGDGEFIIRTALAAQVIGDLRAGRFEEAIGATFDRLGRVGGEAGLILIDRHGRMAFGHNSAQFAVAYGSQDTGLQAVLERSQAPLSLQAGPGAI